MQRLLAPMVLLATNACYGGNVSPTTSDATPPVASPEEGSCTTAWCVSHVLPSAGHDLQAVWASGSDAWATDFFGNVLHHDAQGWSTDTELAWSGAAGVWGTSGADLWVVGETVRHWNGASWMDVQTSSVVITTLLSAVWGSASNDVWIGGGGGRLEHWDGKAWSSFGYSEASGALPWNYDITSIWGSASTDVWFVGDVGFTHWDGQSLTGPKQMLSQIAGATWGSGPRDVWAVGEFGVIGHFDGTTWSEVPSPTSKDLSAVWGSGPSDVWAVGGAGTILHWDGAAWTVSPSGVEQALNGVWGTGPSDVWVAGSSVILHHK